MLKAVHLTSVHNPFDNRVFYKECKTLKKAGYEVILIAPYPKDENVDGIKIRGIEKLNDKIKRLTITVYKVFQRAIKEHADIYHIHDPELLLVGFILRLKGYKVIFDMHENVPKSIRSKDWIPSYLRKAIEFIYTGIENIILKKLAVIFAESSYSKEYDWLTNTEVVLNLPRVDKILNINTSKNSKFSVGYIGEITKLRGCISTVEALNLLKMEGNDVCFECVGDGPETEFSEVRRIAERYQIDANFYGFKSSSEGLSIISRCHIGLALLSRIPNYTHSYPTKIFEYMALGIPVITSDFLLYKSVVEEYNCGLCVDPDDLSAIANAISKLRANPEMAREMGEAGKRAVQEKFTWEKESKKLIKFYEKNL